MKLLKLATIVEGDGEVAAVPILLRRWNQEFAPDAVFHVLKPIRQPRDRLLQNKGDCLQKSINLAVGKLRQLSIPGAKELILVLVDADKECAATAGPKLQSLARSLRSDMDIVCVLAVWEYETWFVSAAESLCQYLHLDETTTLPEDPEGEHCRKGWIERRFRGVKYVEPIDQPKLTSALDLTVCRRRSPSFDKLSREIEMRLM